jgi:hypothetical protein
MSPVFSSIIEAYKFFCATESPCVMIASGIFIRASDGIARDLTGETVTPSVYFVYHNDVPYRQVAHSPIRLTVVDN